MEEVEKKAKHTLGKEKQIDFKLPREQTKTQIVKTKQRFFLNHKF